MDARGSANWEQVPRFPKRTLQGKMPMTLIIQPMQGVMGDIWTDALRLRQARRSWFRKNKIECGDGCC